MYVYLAPDKSVTNLVKVKQGSLEELIKDNRSVIELVVTPNKDVRSRLGIYCAWLDEKRFSWYQPELALYRDSLFEAKLAPTSIASHLSTVRGAYKRLLVNNKVRDALYTLTPPDASPADRKAFVDEIVLRIRNGIDPIFSKVNTTTFQDRDEREQIRLSGEEANHLLRQPGVDTLKGLRDTAIIALLLCTGIREHELSNLFVEDLRAKLGREPALRIRRGKGNKARLIPYGELDWCLTIIDTWLKRADIKIGPVFRGVYKGEKTVRDTAISTRAIEYILADYPIRIAEQVKSVRPHDCRRTYARRLFEDGMDVVAIQQNLGHSSMKTTLRYIGDLDADQRRATAVYDFDIRQLD